MIRPKWDYNVYNPVTEDETWTEDIAEALGWWLAHPGSQLVRYPIRYDTGEAEVDTLSPEELLTPDDWQAVDVLSRTLKEVEG